MIPFHTGREVLKSLEALAEKNRRSTLRVAQQQEKEESDRKQQELQELLKPVPPFTGEAATEVGRASRLALSNKDFWFWDEIYFPKELYPDYAEPAEFHRELCRLTSLRDKNAHVIHGPRGFAKTATLKKKFVYDLLHGVRRYMLLGGETLTPAANSLRDIVTFLDTNNRILHDYNIVWHQANEDTLFLQTSENPKGSYVSAISIERSTKGLQRGFFIRPDYVYLTDIENATSSLTSDSIALRIERINEMRTSLSDDGTLIWEGNNFNPACAMNHLVREQVKGVLSPYFKLHIFPAWGIFHPLQVEDPACGGGDKGEVINPQSEIRIPKSLWPQRYPAQSEEELKALCKPRDLYDWLGNFQGTPRAKSGDIFPDTFYAEWSHLPPDLRGVIFTDPNCSLKEKGDTTAITALGWSPSTFKYYVIGAHCKSYDDSDKLLMDVLVLRGLLSDVLLGGYLGFDGNVNQESTWTNNVRNFIRIHKMPLPHIEYRRYDVDLVLKNTQGEYQKGNILFPPEFRKSDEGIRYTDQLFAFKGKKANKKDDAPDSLICAYELLQNLFSPSIGGEDDLEIRVLSTRSITGKL